MRNTTRHELKETHFNLASQSRAHKTLIAEENEMISKMSSLIRRCTSVIGNCFDTVKQASVESAAVDASVQAQDVNNLQGE